MIPMAFIIVACLFCLGCAAYTEYQAEKSRQAAARSGIGATRSNQAAERAERAAWEADRVC